MSASLPATSKLPSLLSVTLRRGVLAGRLYLGIGLVVSLVLTAALLRGTRGSAVFATTFPLELPLFATMGAMGGLLLFVNDRSKGVLEYLISYGVRPRTLFVNALLVTVTLSTIVLGAALAVGIGGYLALGNPMTTGLEESIGAYTIPMTYSSAMFATICGIVWSTLSTPRMGMNSPVGVAPILGVAPPVLVLILAESAPTSSYYYVTASAGLGFIAIVIGLLLLSSRLMGRERYLSPL